MKNMEPNELANGKRMITVAGEEVGVDANGSVKDALKISLRTQVKAG